MLRREEGGGRCERSLCVCVENNDYHWLVRHNTCLDMSAR